MSNDNGHINLNILSTKLLIPVQSDVNIHRPRLQDRLAKGQHRKLTLISAPAGFGKTTLLSEWVQKGESQFAWLTLDNTDNDLHYFFSYLISALRTIDDNLLNETNELITSPEKFSTESTLTSLINSITDYSRPLALVLDDYHLIREDDVHNAVIFLLNHLPHNLHLIIATRVDPPLPIALLRSRMQLNEIRAADLRFNEEETAAFLKKLINKELSPENIKNLTNRTEGWVAGIQMIALSMQGKKDIHEYINSLAGTQAFISDYLTNEVLEQQTERVKTFLLKTSILQILTGSLCDAVIGGNGSEVILQELYEKNLFLAIVDSSKGLYRYHPLFAEVLSHRLYQDFPEITHKLHEQASIWYEQHKQLNRAIEHALLAENFERAAILIDMIASKVFMRGENDTILTWIDELPENVIGKNLTLCVFRALAQILNGYPEREIKKRLREISELSSQQPQPGEVWVVKALLASQLRDTDRSLDYCRRASELLPREKDFFRGFIIGNLGKAYLQQGNLPAAFKALTEALQISQNAGDKPNTLIINTWLGDTYLLEGKLHEAKSYYDQALSIASQITGSSPPILGWVMSSLGRLYLEWNDLEQAENLLESGIQMSRHLGLSGTIVAQLSRVELKIVQGAFDEAEDILNEISHFIDQIGFSREEQTDIERSKIRLWLAKGTSERAIAWSRSYESDLEPSYDKALGLRDAKSRLVTAQIKIANARKFTTTLPNDVITMLEALIMDTRKARWDALRREALVCIALAYDLKDEQTKALKYLKEALDESVRENHIRIFLQEGQVLRRLLYKALERGYSPKFSSRLLMTIEHEKLPPDLHYMKNATIIEADSYIQPLSVREIEVLHLLEEGCSNKDIAERLFISLSTVKAHLYNIYGKLDVHSRTQALAKAHALGILKPEIVI